MSMRSVFQIGVCCASFIVSCSALASEKLRIDGSTGVKPLVEALSAGFQLSRQSTPIEIGTGLKPDARIQALLDNKIDIAMASHGIDIERITDLGLQVHRFAKMAVVLGVNHNVTVQSLSHADVCNIYAGITESWQVFGGKEQPIEPLLRPKSEVDFEVVSAHIPCFSSIQIRDDIRVLKKSGQMAKAIAKTHGAIGMTTQVRVNQSKGKIKAMLINGIQPNTANLTSGDYPLTRDSFLITSSKPSEKVSAFLHFIGSEVGATIIENNDAVPAQ